jgi:hypothetical protein
VGEEVNAVPHPEPKPMATSESTLELTDLQKMLQNAWTHGYQAGYGKGFEHGTAIALGKGD